MSERGAASEQGISMGEGSDALMRGQESASQGRDSLAKMSQVIQVSEDSNGDMTSLRMMTPSIF